jgi:SAM-dependent methyltransferase
MSEPYPEFVARFYDPVYAQIRDGTDNEFYLRLITSAAGPALEIGSGTGRLLVEALRRGADVWGIDLSAAMVERCREKLAPRERDRVSVADAVRLRTDRRFALVVAPFRVLSHVPEPADQLRLLDAVHHHLVPGGRFVLDLYLPDLKLLLQGLPELRDFEGEWAPGRRLVRRVSSLPADLARQTSHVRMSFDWEEEDGEHHGDWEFEMRFFFRYEIEHLVARSKLRLERIDGDFEGGPLTAESHEYVVTCRRDA